MLEWIPSLLKIFLEKYFITTIVAVLGAIVVTAFTPDNYWLHHKLGVCYHIGIFCLCFLIFHFLWRIILFSKNQINKKIKKNQERKRYCEQIMTAFDKCSREQRQMAYDFLKSKNQCIIMQFSPYPLGSDSIFSRNIDFQQLENGNFRVKLKENFYKLLSYIYKKHGKISHFN